MMRALHDDVVKIFQAEKYEPLRIKDYSDYRRDVESFELQGEAMHVEYVIISSITTHPVMCHIYWYDGDYNNERNTCYIWRDIVSDMWLFC